jgi:hypothetical protein
MPTIETSKPKRYFINPPTTVKSVKNIKPVDAKCELTGQETRSLYGAVKALHEHTANNYNAARGDLGPLKRELGKIKWYDCTAWDSKGKCTYPDCDGGLH